MTERIKNWRQKKSEEGGRSLTVMLEPDSVNILEELQKKYQQSHSKLISLALEALNESFTCKQKAETKTFTCKHNKEQPEAASDGKTKAPSNGQACIPLFSEIREQLDQGATVLSLKKEIIGAMKEMRKRGYDSSQIADLLYEEGINTIKGKERWESGTIRKYWK